MNLGTVLLIVTVLTGVCIVCASPLIHRVRNFDPFWAGLGLFVFAYVFFGRQLQYMMGPYSNAIDSGRSVALSRLLLLDLCPFYAIFGSLALLVRNKQIAKTMAPFGLFGAMVTIFGQIVTEANSVAPNDYWQYVFVGDDLNQLYFMMHYLSFAMGLAVLCWTKRWSVRTFGLMHAFALGYFGYVLVMVACLPQIVSNTTGVLAADWLPGGEYYGVGLFLGMTAYPPVMVVGYVLSYVAISLFFWLRFGCALLWKKYKAGIVALLARAKGR